MEKSIRIFTISLLVCLFGCNEGKGPEHETRLNGAGGPTYEKNEQDLAVKPLEFDVRPFLKQEKEIVANFPKSSNELSFDFYKEFNKEQNPVFSPLSISLALAMAYAGAQEETEQVFKKVLHFGDNNNAFHKAYGDFPLLLGHKDRSTQNTNFEISNTLWLQEGYSVLESFKSTLKNAYNARPIGLDFLKEPARSTKVINQTIAEQTHGEIPQLLKSELSARTRLVLTNALYFKSTWQKEFTASDTYTGQFTLSDGTPLSTKLMEQEMYHTYGQDDQKQFLLMPYEDTDFAALFVLPSLGKLEEVEKSMNTKTFEDMFQNLSTKLVNLRLPKFSQRALPQVTKILIKLGLDIAFDSNRASFKGIGHGVENFYIEDVVHEAVVKMYEEGTTAAAATAIVSGPTASMPGPVSEPVPVIKFHADRPFLFYIIHQPSKTILFMGRVDEPKSDAA